MYERDRSLPYSIHVPNKISSAELHVGWRSYPVKLQTLNWQDVTVLASRSVAKRLSGMRRGKLHYANGTSPVRFASSTAEADGSFSIRLTREEPGAGRPQADASDAMPTAEQSLQSDPFLITMLLGAAGLAFLVLPGWGGEWGTSGPLTESLATVGRAVHEFFRDLL